MKRKVLIVIHSSTYFIELFRLAKCLLLSGKYEPLILFAYKYPTYPDDVSSCIQYKITCLDSYGKQVVEGGYYETLVIESLLVTGKNRFLLARLKKFLKIIYRKLSSFFRQFSSIKMIYEYKSFLDTFSNIRNILKEIDPSLLVLGGDNVGYNTSIYIKIAHNEKVSVVIVPSTMSNGLEEAEAFFHAPNHNLGVWINRLAARLCPQWVFEHRGRKLLRIPGERVFLMEWFGLTPPLPWIFNSGYADVIAVESERMKNYYLDCGLPDGQLRLIGSLADDLMVNNYKQKKNNRAELCSDLGLKDDKPILLSALPPDFLYMPGGRPECDFKTYPELVSFWVQSITAVKDCNVLVCLHPSDKYENFKYFEKWGVKIARRNTAELVPLCDIYVASVSSTIRWAIACGIPVINYDVYRYRYTDYLGLVGVLTIEEQDDFKSTLAKLTVDRSYYFEKKLAQESIAQNWGMFDGNVANRMIALLDEFAKK